MSEFRCDLDGVGVAATHSAKGLTSVRFVNAPKKEALTSEQKQLKKELLAALKGQRPLKEVPVDWSQVEGTDFQKKVWKTMMKIPRGKVWAYGELAKKVGSPGGARAIGGACGKNPLVLVVPCHRVVSASGLGGFSGGGLGLKRRLLSREGVSL